MSTRKRLRAIAENTSFKVSTIVFVVVVLAASLGPASLAAAMGLLLALCIVATIFPIVYWVATRGEWKNSLMGQTLMAQAVIIALMVDFTLLGNIGLVPLNVIVFLAIVLYTGLILVKVNLIRIVLKVTSSRRKKVRANDRPA